MRNIVGVKFKDTGEIYYFDPVNEKLEIGDKVIVETSVGVECADVIELGKKDNEEINHELKPIIRKAQKHDLLKIEENRKKENEAIKTCEKIANDYNLDMKLISAKYSFDRKKIIFYFTADGRIDFRNLVKNLASKLKTRIELRQVGIRDEARMLGGLGICGRVYCCKNHLNKFEPVSIKMAKEQGLSLNPVAISGGCGRLLCCLKYEQNSYSYLIKKTPQVGAKVKTPEGNGTVTDINLIKGTVKVKMDDTPDVMPKQFLVSKVRAINDKK